MTEKNKHILAQAIQKLPTYSVPKHIWNEIEGDLVIAEQNALIEQSIPFLPEYSPPTTIWDAIETSLGESTSQAKIVPFQWRKILAYAALVGGLSFTFFWFFTTPSEMTTSIAFSEEIINESSLNDDWNTDEEAFEMVLGELDASPVFNQIPAVKDLRIALAELKTAKMEIEEMMEAYGKDEAFITQIRDIELERTDIIKQLAAYLV